MLIVNETKGFTLDQKDKLFVYNNGCVVTSRIPNILEITKDKAIISEKIPDEILVVTHASLGTTDLFFTDCSDELKAILKENPEQNTETILKLALEKGITVKTADDLGFEVKINNGD